MLRVYESVDDNSLSKAISQKPTKKKKNAYNKGLTVLLLSYAFWTSSVRDPNKTFLTLVEIIKVTKSFLYMELEDYYFEENEKYTLHYLFAGLLE